jgi:hypothetical protein
VVVVQHHCLALHADPVGTGDAASTMPLADLFD